MTHNYIVTAQKSTAVFNCVSGNFTSHSDLNLILEKVSGIEVHLVTPEGLRFLKEINIYGKIRVMQEFRLPDEKKDLLFICTMKHNAFILEINRDTVNNNFEVITRANGIILERVGKESENGTICRINPDARVIVLRIYDGLLNMIKMDFKNKEIKSFNVRVEENVLIDVAFLRCYDKPTLCLIYQEDQCRHLKTYEITEDRELRRGPWIQENIESDSRFLIDVPDPYGGVIVIGQESIIYIVDQNNYSAIAPPLLKRAPVQCYCMIDSTRFLLSDLSGRIFLLILLSNNEEGKPGSSSVPCASAVDLKLIYLGETSIPSCMSYLDNSFIYIGSKFGDSQLVKLNLQAVEEGDYIEVVDSYTNLAPIVDMLVVDLDKQGQDQLVTCSGFSKEGSIRIIRNGIGLNELASIDLPSIKGVFQLRVESELDNLVAISFVGQTKLLKLVNEEVEETSLDGFDCTRHTLFCGNIEENGHEMILQATANSIRLISIIEKRVLSEWTPPNNSLISLISINNCQILCSSRTMLYYLEVIDKELKLTNELTMEFEASCLDISPLGEQRSKLCSVGLWKDISVNILTIPELKLLHTEKLGGEIIARSTLIALFDHTSYLFTAIGDGSLLYYLLDNKTGVLSEKKKVILGTHPTSLKIFKTNHSANIFACSDRPTVIYSSNGKLIFSNVNLKEVNHMCTLNSVGYPDSLILTNDAQLLIGQIDQIQKLHIRTIPLGEMPRRIAYQESTQTFGVTTMRVDYKGDDGQTVPVRKSASVVAQNITYSSSLPTIVKPNLASLNDTTEFEVYHLLIIDQTTFEILHAHQFMANEIALSLCTAKLGPEQKDYYVVGTCYMVPDELEPKLGRIIVFQLSEGKTKLQQVIEKEVKGAPYQVTEFKGQILAAINSSIRLFEWTSTNDLNNEATHYNSVITAYLKTKGDFVLAGDILRSMTLVSYKPMSGSFEVLGVDRENCWLTCIEIIDDENFIGADTHYNFFLVQKDVNLVGDSDRYLLNPIGFYHIGDNVNVMTHGYLVMNYPCEMNCPILNKPILYGTVSGCIGLIAQIPKEYYDLLLALQKNLAAKLKSPGKIDHEYWRSYTTEKKTEPPTLFIDGDLIESFLDLSRTEMAECTDGLTLNGNSKPASVDDIIKVVEELSRIH